MSVEDDILTELQWQTKLVRAQLVELNEIKYVLLNNQAGSGSTYTIPIIKPTVWARFRYWLRGKIKG